MAIPRSPCIPTSGPRTHCSPARRCSATGSSSPGASHIAAAAAVVSGHTAISGLDGLVNNAGFGVACPTELVQVEAFRRELEVNVTGQLAVTQAMLPSLRRARGRIVLVS